MSICLHKICILAQFFHMFIVQKNIINFDFYYETKYSVFSARKTRYISLFFYVNTVVRAIYCTDYLSRTFLGTDTAVCTFIIIYGSL